MNKKLLILPLLLILPFISSCNEDPYDPTLFTAQIHKTYQVYDNFDKFDLVVSYNGLTIDSHEYSVDLSKFDSSKVGECSISVSPTIREEVIVNIPIKLIKDILLMCSALELVVVMI